MKKFVLGVIAAVALSFGIPNAEAKCCHVKTVHVRTPKVRCCCAVTACCR